MVPGKRFDRYHELGQHAFGEKLGLWVVVPQQVIVEVGVDIAYMITGGKSLQKFHNTVCPDCKPFRTVDDNNGAEVQPLCSSCRSVPSPTGTWAIRTSRRASSTLSTTPRCKILTLYFSFSLVLILSSDLLHDFYSNLGIGPVPAMVEADTTRSSHTGLDRVVPVSTKILNPG